MWIKVGSHAWLNESQIWQVRSDSDGAGGWAVFAATSGVSSYPLRTGLASQADADAWIADTFFERES